MELKETMLTRKEIYSGRVFRVTRDEILLPDGSRGIRELVHSYGGVVILPMDEQGNVTLVHQFRYAQDRVLLEAVAGKLEAGEEPFAAAKRELREETGFTADRRIWGGSALLPDSSRRGCTSIWQKVSTRGNSSLTRENSCTAKQWLWKNWEGVSPRDRLRMERPWRSI